LQASSIALSGVVIKTIPAFPEIRDRSVEASPSPIKSRALSAEASVLLAIPAIWYPHLLRRYPMAVPTTPAPIIAIEPFA
jgi:hypothetical protein